MASFFNIVHKTDKAFAPFHASTREYATRLFMAIHEKRPELAGHLEIVEIIPQESKTAKAPLDRPWNCSL